MTNVSARRALTTAMHNDRRGIVSRADAERIVEAGLGEIAAATDPAAALQNAQRFVAAGQALVGRDHNATDTLNSFRSRGQDAVRARIEELTGNKQLPTSVTRSFDDRLGPYGSLEVDGPATFTNVKGDDQTGYTFDWAAGNKSGKAYAIPFEGQLVLTDRPVPTAMMKAAVDEMRSYFDSYFATDLLNYGETAASIADMRSSIGISSFLWAGEDDPVGANSSYDFAFSMHNPTGSDHGFYVGVNRDGTAGADSFN